ncbi:MAG: amidohydrolase family protein [Gaiellales bacterium]
MRDLEIVGGRIVTPDGVVDGDLIVREGKIAAISARGVGRGPDAIDASGCLVLPGGVDPHCHALVELEAAAVSAAHGGTTTLLTFTLPEPGEQPLAALVRARDACVPRSLVDVGVHASYFDPRDVTPALLARLQQEGATGAQVFLAFPELGLKFDDGQLYRVLRDAATLGLPVQVQCENGALVDALTDELIAAGETAPRAYPRSRPGAVEDEAVARTLTIAAIACAPAYLVHLSTAVAVELARVAIGAGAPITVEACTHHLLLDASAYERADAARFIVGPPLRPAADVDALWEAIADGTVAAVGSDHSHMPDPAARPAPTSFVGAPMGLPGLELRLPLVLSEGLRRGVPIEMLVAVLASGPARSFGIYPQKGALAVGSDADIVVWDPGVAGTVRATDLHDGLGHTPYEGLPLAGAVRLTVLRGVVIVRDGARVGGPPEGRGVRPARTRGAN